MVEVLHVAKFFCLESKMSRSSRNREVVQVVVFWIVVKLMSLESEIWGSSRNRELVLGGQSFECG